MAVPAKPAAGSVASRKGARPAAGPRAALLIDDLGQNPAHLRALVGLDLTLSVAVLPGLPFTSRTVREARRQGIEVLLHLPMQAQEAGRDPGPGALMTSMAPAEIAARVHEAFAAVPGAVGVNNHMGSRFTEDRAAMNVLMGELRGSGAFWLDSRTTGASAAGEAAADAGVPALSRDIFLDAEVDREFVRRQIRKLVALARRRGTAIGIGHPYPETLETLAELREEILASGVAWVPVSALAPARPQHEARLAPPPPDTPARRAAGYPALAADATKR